jgi:hypothetical protein
MVPFRAQTRGLNDPFKDRERPSDGQIKGIFLKIGASIRAEQVATQLGRDLPIGSL